MYGKIGKEEGLAVFLFRWLGTVFVLFALVAIAVDGTKSLAANDLVFTPLGQHWRELHVASLNNLQVALERYLLPVLWDPVMLNVLLLPAWVVLGAIGLLLCLVGRRRERRDPFIN